MTRKTRRQFLKTSLASGLAFSLPSLLPGAQHGRESAGPNSEIRIAVIGMGGMDIVGGVGGRGRQLISGLRQVPGAKVVALCDVDQAILEHEVQQCKDHGETVAAYRDLRKVFDDKSIDAVAISTPNHWHALATIWACQAGKDVYVEKPFSYNIWEGRQMVAAARKFGRIVQVGTQSRSSEVLRQAFEYLRSGQLGAIRFAHALVYRARDGIGKISGPTPVPATVDYELWCGPAPKSPVLHKQLHYEWHWFWPTGNGEIGNNGAHMIDVACWALGQQKPPTRAMSIGGRFAFDDDGETPNTQIAIWDYQPAPMICEIRNLRKTKEPDSLGKYRGITSGVVIDCEGGYFAGASTGGAMFDKQGQKIKDLPSDRKPREVEAAHLANFVSAVQSRKADELHAEALQGHVSAACSHIANISHRLGKQTAPQAIAETNRANAELSDAFERCREHLRLNGVDLSVDRAVLGPWLSFDCDREQFVGEFAEQANALCRRDYRTPFVVPQVA